MCLLCLYVEICTEIHTCELYVRYVCMTYVRICEHVCNPYTYMDVCTVCSSGGIT